MKIADIIRAGIAAGNTNEAILTAVKAEHPQANTNAACVNWYRNQARKQAGEPTKKAVADVVEGATNGHGFELRGVKFFKGMEGEGFNANLYLGGKRVAELIDDASGGPLMVHWSDKDAEKKLAELVAASEPVTCDFTENGKPVVLAMTEELYLNQLVDDYHLAKQLKSLTTGKVAFMSGREVYTIKGALTDKLRQNIASRHPKAVILNGLPVAEALAKLRGK